jgi:hypothetical protein
MVFEKIPPTVSRARRSVQRREWCAADPGPRLLETTSGTPDQRRTASWRAASGEQALCFAIRALALHGGSGEDEGVGTFAGCGTVCRRSAETILLDNCLFSLH